MDFTSRNSQQTQTAGPAPQLAKPATGSGKSGKDGSKGSKWTRFGAIALLFAVALLVVAMLFVLVFGKGSNEAAYVDDGKYQAVFLDNGQVYFGKVKALNDEVVDLRDIYYLQTSSTDEKNTNSNVSLVKLGCELHTPYDQMIISRSKVTFWENLKDDGQVGKAIAQYKEQNPDGQKCETTTQNSSNNGVQGSTKPSQSGSGNTNTNTEGTTTP
jgi:hypothetical protein